MSDKKPSPNYRFLSEALPLIASYFSGTDVDIASKQVSANEDEDWGAAFREFISLIRFRHALGCCEFLIPILQAIEAGASYTTRLTRERTKSVIRGRLDIPLYMAERASARFLSKSFPIISVDETPNTPENRLAKQLMSEIRGRFHRAAVPENTAEKLLATKYSAAISKRIAHYPWCETDVPSGGLRRNALEAKRRIAKRQTGNEPAYRNLTELVDRWLLDFDRAGPINNYSAVIGALLAFPSSSAFDDRIFEIWCLKEVADAFVNCGTVLQDGPNSLDLNLRKPIYTFQAGAHVVKIWFQRALTAEFAGWFYESGKPLRGIPDITVEANSQLLLVDAKHRLAEQGVRPEETYKMLGYFENFRQLLPRPVGVVCFTSFDDFDRTLSANNGGMLRLVSAHPLDRQCCKFGDNLANLISQWLASI